MAARIDLVPGAAPSTPSAGVASVYVDSADRLAKVLDEKGVLSRLARSGLNLCRNSGMWFAQRQAPATPTNCGNTTTRAQGLLTGCDGWGIWNENANTTFARTDTSTTPETNLQSRYYASWLKVTSTGKFFVSQMIEALDCQALRGRTVRLQGKMKGTGAQITRLGLVQLASAATVDTLPATFISAAGANLTDPTLGTNLAYIAPKAGVTGDNCTLDGNAYDCSVTTAWQRFGGVFDIPAGAKNLLPVFFTDSQATVGVGFSLSEVSLTDGMEIQDWEPLPYTSELARVERYFCKTHFVDTAPVAASGANLGELHFHASTVGAIATAGFMWRYPTRMRAAATQLALLNPAAAGAQIRNVTDAADFTGSSVTGVGETGAWITGTGNAGLIAGENCAVHCYADACGANNEFA